MMRLYHVAWSLLVAGSVTASAAAQVQPAPQKAPVAAAASPAKAKKKAAPAAAAPAAATAAPAAPSTPAAPAAASPAPAAIAAAPTTTAPPNAVPEAAAAASNPYTGMSPEASRLARERWQLEILRARARARAERANARATTQKDLVAEDESDGDRLHGDAGAPIAVGASWESPWYTDASFDVFSSKDVASRFGLWAAYDIASLRSDTIAALEIGWATEHVKDDALLGSTLGSELTTNAFHAGAQLRWVPVDWLQPHARLAAGAALVSMALQTAGQRFADQGVSPFASLGLGFTLRTPTRLFEDKRGQLAPLSLGLMLEGGYTLAAPLDFNAEGPSAGKGAIPLTDSKLGRLARSGPYARASIVVRF